MWRKMWHVTACKLEFAFDAFITPKHLCYSHGTVWRRENIVLESKKEKDREVSHLVKEATDSADVFH